MKESIIALVAIGIIILIMMIIDAKKTKKYLERHVDLELFLRGQRVYTKFVKNIQRELVVSRAKAQQLIKEFDKEPEPIKQLFHWDDSPEGYLFWYEINELYLELKQQGILK